MTYTHLKVEEDSKAKFKKLASNHKLSMLRLFGLWVDTEYKKLDKHTAVSDVELDKPLATTDSANPPKGAGVSK